MCLKLVACGSVLIVTSVSFHNCGFDLWSVVVNALINEIFPCIVIPVP